MNKFEFDMFLGGPPDRRAPFPYKQIIKAAFPDLKIYDWESYKDDDYQSHNNQMLKASQMMVSLVPNFPMPGIGPELGYFCAIHEKRIEEGKQGLFLGHKSWEEKQRDGDVNENDDAARLKLVRKVTPPINYAILIWPDSVQPDFTKKTIASYALIVPTVEEAIEQIKASLANIEQHEQFTTMEAKDWNKMQLALSESFKRLSQVKWKSKKEDRYGKK